jgi:hypothetical protein
MNTVAQNASTTPLNALVWVFGLAAAAVLALFATTMLLAANHRRRRDRGRYRSELSEFADKSKARKRGPDPFERSIRALTTGDLVADSDARRTVIEIATELGHIRP